MALPLSVRTSLTDRPLLQGVHLRVLRLHLALTAPRFGGVWAVAVPLGVIDATGPRRRFLPLIDATLVRGLFLLVAALLLIRMALPPWRRQGQS
jgi:hypothetical protein